MDAQVTETPNPYRAPLVDDPSARVEPSPADYIPGRLEFDTEISLADHRDAIVKAGIRKEYKRIPKTLFVYAGGLAAIAGLILQAQGAVTPLQAVLATVCFLLGSGVFAWQQRRFLRELLPSFQFFIGRTVGWIDQDGLTLKSSEVDAYYPLSALVSSAASSEIWVLCFNRDGSFWQTLPFSGFDDPRIARNVADHLRRLCPPIAGQMVDARRFQPPTDAPRYHPQGESIDYDGQLAVDAAKGTRLIRAARRLRMQSWLSVLALMLGVITAAWSLFWFDSFAVGLAVVWMLILVGSIVVRLIFARLASRRNGQSLYWHSRGWLDDHGYFSMTAIGQSRIAWSMFRDFEITDRVIGLYPRETDLCCCLIGKQQFASEADWDAAVQKVRKSMAR